VHGFSLGLLAFFFNMLFQPVINMAVFHVVLVPVDVGRWALNVWFWLLSIFTLLSTIYWIYFVWKKLANEEASRKSGKLQNAGWAGAFPARELRSEMLCGTDKLWTKNVNDWTCGYKKDNEILRLAAMDHFCFRFASGFVVGALFASPNSQPVILTLVVAAFSATPIVFHCGYDAYKSGRAFAYVLCCRVLIFVATFFSTVLKFDPGQADTLGPLVAVFGGFATVVPILLEESVHGFLDKRLYSPCLDTPLGKWAGSKCSACAGAINSAVCQPLLASAACVAVATRLASRRQLLADSGGSMNPVMQELGMSSPTDTVHKVVAPAQEIEMVYDPDKARRQAKQASLTPATGAKAGRENVVQKGTRPMSKSYFEGETTKEGRLQKLSSGAMKRWQARHFRLAGHYLSYLPTAASDISEASKIDLDSIATCTFNGREIMIGLPHEEAWACSYRLKASSSAEAVEWSNHIRAAAGMKQRLTPGPKSS